MLPITFLVEALQNLWQHIYVLIRRTLCCWNILPFQDPTDTEQLLLRRNPPGSVDQSYTSVQSEHVIEYSDTEAPAEPAPITSVPAPPVEQHQIIYVMRHGHRQDELDRDWSVNATRPWDPPLSDLGRQQAREAGVRLTGTGITKVVTSPFVRCLQTSAEIVAELGLKQGQWVVGWGLSEVCGPKQMHGNQGGKAGPVDNSSLSSWMWQGDSLEEALSSFMSEERSKSRVAIRPELVLSNPPTYPESLQDAFQRYCTTIQEFMGNPGHGDLLLVTHGEAVGRAVTMFESSSVVYEVNHTGYTRLRRTRAVDGSWNPWLLDCQSGETGVSWFADEGGDF